MCYGGDMEVDAKAGPNAISIFYRNFMLDLF